MQVFVADKLMTHALYVRASNSLKLQSSLGWVAPVRGFSGAPSDEGLTSRVEVRRFQRLKSHVLARVWPLLSLFRH